MQATNNSPRHPASFRDPSGFIFKRDGVLYRQVNQLYGRTYDQLNESGLFTQLTRDHLLIAHEQVDEAPAETDIAHCVIQPAVVPFISYPYEWCFSQLKDAALLTLDIQSRALQAGFSLKDCSAYNVQFIETGPVLIDTLSFEPYEPGMPWPAYRQFCEHFLGPLALMALRDVRLGAAQRAFLDGIDLQLVSRLLPRRTWMNFGLLVHLHLHARSQRRHAGRLDSATVARTRRVSQLGMIGLVDSLRRSVQRLHWSPRDTPWSDYTDQCTYSSRAADAKAQIVGSMIADVQPKTAWDLGANVGTYSRMAADAGAATVAFDADAGAVEQHYLQLRDKDNANMLPLIMDVTNPSPSLGFGHQERDGLLARGPADVVLALALIHHLAIGHNVPLDRLAEFLSQCGRSLIIEFVPRTDSQVQRLLASREDIFSDYDEPSFERCFETVFSIERRASIDDSSRVIYLMTRKD